MADNKEFYRVYEDCRFEPGHYVEIKNSVTFQGNNADVLGLFSLDSDELHNKLESSINSENALYEKMLNLVEEWKEQAANTMLTKKAIEYVDKPPIVHTSNEWVQNNDDPRKITGKISNMVYEMFYQIHQVTKFDHSIGREMPNSWNLTWGVYIQSPSGGGVYGNVLGGETSKRFATESRLEKHLKARKAEYAHLFSEISPPIPNIHKDKFCVNGKLLPGYTLEEQKPKETERKAGEAVDEKPKRGRKPSIIGGLNDAKKTAATLNSDKERQKQDKGVTQKTEEL